MLAFSSRHSLCFDCICGKHAGEALLFLAKLMVKDSEGTDEYVSDNKTMAVFANVHARLEHKRSEEARNGGEGPRVMVVGPKDTGKSTLVRLLLRGQ